MAPMLALVPSLTTFLVLPFGPEVEIFGHTTKLVVIDSDAAILLFLALASLGVYSLVLAGSARTTAVADGLIRLGQLISYSWRSPPRWSASCPPSMNLSTSSTTSACTSGGQSRSRSASWSSWSPRSPRPTACRSTSGGRMELVGSYHTEYGSMRLHVLRRACR
jgi:NADH-quinone oxidoreductase subunit H